MNWAIAGTGDFNCGGKSDLLWRNSSTGVVVACLMNGLQVTGSAILGGDPNWPVAGAGDFKGDGNSDILWRNSAGGVVEWLMNGAQVTGSAIHGGDLNWKPVAV